MRDFAGYERKPLHVAAVADATGAEMLVQAPNGSYRAGCFQISGTVTTATVTFECTVDGTNWTAMECTSVAASATVSTTATAAGTWRFNAEGLYAVRANLNWTAGSVTVYGTLIA